MLCYACCLCSAPGQLADTQRHPGGSAVMMSSHSRFPQAYWPRAGAAYAAWTPSCAAVPYMRRLPAKYTSVHHPGAGIGLPGLAALVFEDISSYLQEHLTACTKVAAAIQMQPTVGDTLRKQDCHIAQRKVDCGGARCCRQWRCLQYGSHSHLQGSDPLSPLPSYMHAS